jgi:hypothetical protein
MCILGIKDLAIIPLLAFDAVVNVRRKGRYMQLPDLTG